MSELTTPINIDIPGIGSIESADLYLKSEADKVIEEKDMEIKELKADKLTLMQRLNVLDGKFFGLSQSHNIEISKCGSLERLVAELKAENKRLKARIAELEARNHDLEEERRWRKCSDGLPLAKQRVLFLAKYKTDKVREWIGDFRHIDGMKEDFAVFYASAPGWGCEFLIDEVIGWMPLPSAPKEEE